MGVVNSDPAVSLHATFAAGSPPHGRVGVFSQSGALAGTFLAEASRRALGLSTFVSIGDRADVSGNDLLQYWQADQGTDVVLMHLQGFGNPRKFARIARNVGRSKPVVALKSGRGAGDAAVDALFGSAGVVRVDTLGQLFETGQLLALQPLPAGRRVGIVGTSSALAALAADACRAQRAGGARAAGRRARRAARARGHDRDGQPRRPRPAHPARAAAGRAAPGGRQRAGRRAARAGDAAPRRAGPGAGAARRCRWRGRCRCSRPTWASTGCPPRSRCRRRTRSGRVGAVVRLAGVGGARAGAGGGVRGVARPARRARCRRCRGGRRRGARASPRAPARRRLAAAARRGRRCSPPSACASGRRAGRRRWRKRCARREEHGWPVVVKSGEARWRNRADVGAVQLGLAGPEDVRPPGRRCGG